MQLTATDKPEWIPRSLERLHVSGMVETDSELEAEYIRFDEKIAKKEETSGGFRDSPFLS